MIDTVVARRVLSADRRGSSWPVLVETTDGLRFTKLHGAGQGTGALVAELIVAWLAEALGLRTPAQSLVRVEPNIESLDRDGELRALLDASVGLNLGFAYLDGARLLTPDDVERVSRDDATAIVWLDRFVMNPDRTDRNTNLMWWKENLWLIDHGAALGFQYAWSTVSESTPLRVMSGFDPHVMRNRVADVAAWDEIFAARLTREVIDEAVLQIPDEFLIPLAQTTDSEALRRRRAAYVAFLWKRLKAPRTWATDESATERPRRGPPAWLIESTQRKR